MLVGVGAVAASIIIAWGLIWTPLHNRTTDLQETVADKSRLLNDLRRAEGFGPGARQPNTAANGANQSILLLIDGTARTFGLADSFTQNRPNGPNEISVTFQRAPFESIVAWLIELETAYGVSVESVSMTNTGQPGLVNGQIFLNRS